MTAAAANRCCATCMNRACVTVPFLHVDPEEESGVFAEMIDEEVIRRLCSNICVLFLEQSAGSSVFRSSDLRARRLPAHWVSVSIRLKPRSTAAQNQQVHFSFRLFPCTVQGSEIKSSERLWKFWISGLVVLCYRPKRRRNDWISRKNYLYLLPIGPLCFSCWQ